MQRTTVIGLSVGFGLIGLAIIVQGGLSAFLSLEALLIVLGGVSAAILVNYSVKDLMNTQEAVRVLFRPGAVDLTSDVELMTMLSRRARREGLLALDDDVRFLEDKFLKNGLELAIDGIPEENLISILDDEVKSLERRHQTGIKVLGSMGSYAPAFGMIGTLIGLILMLRNLNNPEGIGPGLSIALVTTFYGTVLSNLVFTPMSGKLEELSEKEVNQKEMLRTAIISISNGENPKIMEKKMLTYVHPEERAEYLRIHGDHNYTRKQDEQLYNHWLNQQKEKWDNVLTNLQTG